MGDIFESNLGKEEQEIFFSKLRTLVVSHEGRLGEMMQAMNDSWDGNTWDAAADVAKLEVGSRQSMTPIADTLGRTKLQNRLFFRITLVFSSLIGEMKALSAECFDCYIVSLSLYGDDSYHDDGISDEEAQKGLGKLVPLLQDLWNWVSRVQKVVQTTVSQLASLYSPTHLKDNYRPYQNVHFAAFWHALIDLLGSVAAVEEVIYGHDTLRQGLNVYRKMLAQMAKNPEKFEADEFIIEQYGKLLNKLDREILDDGILLRICGQMFDTLDISVSNNTLFYEESVFMLSSIVSRISDVLSTSREGEARKKVIGLCSTYVLIFNLFKEKLRSDPGVHKKLCKDVFDLHKKSPVMYIGGITMFKPAQWLARRVPSALSAIVKDPVREGMTSIKTECSRAAAEFLTRLNYLTTVTSVWSTQMSSSYPRDRPRARLFVNTIIQMFTRGITIAHELNRLIKNLIFEHQAADLALSIPLVDGISHAVVQLMTIRRVYHDRMSMIAATFNIIIQTLGYNMQKHLYGLYLRINDVLQASSEAVTDQHTAIAQALALLLRPHTPQNLLALDVVLSIAFTRGDCVFQPKEFDEVLSTLTTMTRIASFQENLLEATECSFLYWHRESFLPIFFSRIFSHPMRSETISYLVTAFHDCRSVILSAKHTTVSKGSGKDKGLMEEFICEVREALEDNIVQPLRTAVENDLRLYTHSAVLGQPFKVLDSSVTELSRFTRLQPFRFFGEWFHLAAHVEDYLDVQFYNLNALHTTDWKTYEEMRNLARERYGLTVCEGYLPGSIVDQGLDVLVITKNIHVFVSNYTYNMNEQLFVQRPALTESKQLHTLHIRHVANSIRTHGTGIMSTTVNYVYKCLLKKLAILSQFLYDDHVKGKLLKEIKHFTNHRDALKGVYPISRAEKYCAEIRKLGLTEDGKSFLDQFRQLISEIGNALGYMRMVRSGGLRSIADAATFIPALDSFPHLEKAVNKKAVREGEDPDEEDEDLLDEEDEEDEEEEEEAEAVGETTIGAVRNVDNVVYNMAKKLAQGSDFFRMLQEAIAKKLKDPEKYGHLKNFYMILPSVCISHVEHMVRQKEQLVKKNKEGLFTDDGFALGCVFLLSLFGNVENFEGLHWFEGVMKHYTDRRQEMENGIHERHEREKKAPKKKKKTNDYEDVDDDLKTMQLTLTMIESSLREYAAVDEAFTSCYVFFHNGMQAAEDDEEEEEEEEEDD